MGYTKRHRIMAKSQTKKNKFNLSIRTLTVGYPLFGAKSVSGDKMIEFVKKEELKHHDSCLLINSSWFGDYEVAKRYKTSDKKIYKWKINVDTHLLKINKNNERFCESLFKNTKATLLPALRFKKQQLDYTHPYLEMTDNQKALFEFKFAFGYITVDEQYKFMTLIEYLLRNGLIDIKTRDNKSILTKLRIKRYYYKAFTLVEKKQKYNRLSFYFFDKYAVMNLCAVLKNTSYNISGIYQANNTSFWFPNLVVYKFNIQEYILFNPHHNLVYDTLIE